MADGNKIVSMGGVIFRLKGETVGRIVLTNYEFIDKVIYEEGTDFGTAGRVILRHKGMRVVWRSGSTGWTGTGQTGYYQSHLSVEFGKCARSSKYVVEGGRLSQKVWAAARPQLAGLLELPPKRIPEQLPEKTVTVA